MTFEEAVEIIHKGNCLLVLGSGFSAEAKNSLGEKLPRAYELANLMDERTGEDSEGDLGLSAESYIEAFGETAMIDFLKQLLTPMSLSSSQEMIAKLPWRRIYTTNYDDIIESGARKAGKRVEGVSLSDNPSDYRNKRNLVVHLNGRLGNLSKATLRDEFKLTNSSYLTQEFTESAWWKDIFVYDLKDCDAVFFIGISLNYDLDIKRIVFENCTAQKSFFILSGDEKKTNIRRISKLGTAKPIGLDNFAALATPQYALSQEARPMPEIPTSAFHRIRNSDSRPEISDSLVRDLLIWGNISDDCLQYSALEPCNYNYLLYRDNLNKAERIIDNGGRNIVIHGNVGNGKSIFLKCLLHRLANNGYNVYLYNADESGNVQRELESICSASDKKTIIAIESYNSNRELVSLFAALRGDCQLIVTERTSLNDIHLDWLKGTLGEEISEISLNRLHDNEIEQLINYLDITGVWGDFAVKKYWQKKRFIEAECRREFRSVLLQLLETKPILDHIRGIVEKVEGNGVFYKSLILVLLSSFADFQTDIYEISSAIDLDLMSNSSFNRNETIKEFIDFSTGRAKATSPIMAEVVLKRLIKPDKIIETVTGMFKRLDQYNSSSDRKVLRKLMTYSTLYTILAPHLGNNAVKKITDFYSNIKDCRICKSNPHFWLQYAIALLETKDFPSAGIYFKNAYSFASDKENFNRVQIDNHYARFLLESGIEYDDDHYLDSFLKAHTLLLNPQFMKETKYYPFKVAKLYLPYYEKYAAKMEIHEMALFKEKVDEMLRQLKTYEQKVGEAAPRRDVAEAKSGLETILNDTQNFKL